MTSTQEYLFENKDKMPEEVYIQLMNNLKKDFEKKENVKKYGFIRVKHIQTVTFCHDDGECVDTRMVCTEVDKIIQIVEQTNSLPPNSILRWNVIPEQRWKMVQDCVNNHGSFTNKDPDEICIIISCQELTI